MGIMFQGLIKAVTWGKVKCSWINNLAEWCFKALICWSWMMVVWDLNLHTYISETCSTLVFFSSLCYSPYRASSGTLMPWHSIWGMLYPLHWRWWWWITFINYSLNYWKIQLPNQGIRDILLRFRNLKSCILISTLPTHNINSLKTCKKQILGKEIPLLKAEKVYRH